MCHLSYGLLKRGAHGCRVHEVSGSKESQIKSLFYYFQTFLFFIKSPILPYFFISPYLLIFLLASYFSILLLVP